MRRGENMQVKEVVITVKLKETIKYENLVDRLSYAMNMFFLGDNKLKKFHKENKFKMYSYSGLYPINPSKVYSEGEIYSIKMRFLDMDFADTFINLLRTQVNAVFIIINIDETTLYQKKIIKKIYTVNPTVITLGNRYWIRNDEEINMVKDKILLNTSKKYKQLMGVDINKYDFIEKIEILNDKPMVFKYKEKKLIGNKFMIHIKEDRFSQELAFMLLGSGVLEKNALSFGFCTVGRAE